MTNIRRAVVASFVLAVPPVASIPLVAQVGFVRVTEIQARQAVMAAAASAKADAQVFTSQFDQEIRKINPDYEYDLRNMIVTTSEPLYVFLAGPVGRLRTAAESAIRRFEPVDKIPWQNGIAVVVAPRQIGSPDVDKIVVTRDGTMVASLLNELKPTVLTTRLGAKVTVHSGSVIFPAAAFDPGAVVAVTAVPRVGQNIVKTFTDKELRKIH